MSEDTIAVIISAATLLVTLAAGFGWTIARTDKKSDQLARDLGEVETRIRKDLGDRIAGVERELVEVKIAVARIEGPGRHLVTSR